jgi:hypothetical protein
MEAHELANRFELALAAVFATLKEVKSMANEINIHWKMRSSRESRIIGEYIRHGDCLRSSIQRRFRQRLRIPFCGLGVRIVI